VSIEFLRFVSFAKRTKSDYSSGLLNPSLHSILQLLPMHAFAMQDL